MFRRVIASAALVVIAALAVPQPARAETCRAFADALVKDTVETILTEVLGNNPQMKELTQKELVIVAGEKLLTAPKPSYRSYGYMMLLWYGDEAARQRVAEVAASLKTPIERAHFYFVMGLYQIGSTTPKVADQGRDYIRQIRESGQVTFANDAMWEQLINGCEISQ